MPSAKQRLPIAPTRAVQGEQLPFTPGAIVGRVGADTVIGTNELTAEELAVLRQAGYSAGDPLPDIRNTAVGRRLQAEADAIRKQEADLTGLLPVDPRTPPLPGPVPRQIDDLPPAERAAAMQAFAEMEELQTRLVAARKGTQPQIQPQLAHIPGYLDAMNVATSNINLIDDIGLGGQLPPALPLRDQPVPPEEAEEPAGKEYCCCPRCNHNLTDEVVVPSAEDKLVYIASIMGDRKRFIKEVSLFGKRIIVEFRSLTTAEVDLAIQQADIAVQNEAITSSLEYARTVEEYKMLMSIGRFIRAGSAPVELPEITAIAFDENLYATPLPVLKAYMDALFGLDTVRRTICTQYVWFTQILAYLEAKAADSDFF